MSNNKVSLDRFGYPHCSLCENESSPLPFWCHHLHNWIAESEDASDISIDTSSVVVPVFPTKEIWTEVLLQSVDSRIVRMVMSYQPDFGPTIKAYLGLWNPGEGRLSMMKVIHDWLKAEVDPRNSVKSSLGVFAKCPVSYHGVRQQTRMSSAAGVDKWVCLWNIRMENACTWCRILTRDDPSEDLANGLDDPNSVPAWQRRR